MLKSQPQKFKYDYIFGFLSYFSVLKWPKKTKKTNAALNFVSVIHCLALLYLTTLQQRAGLFFLEASYCLKDEVGDSRERELIPESHFQAVGRCMIDYFFLYLDRTQTTKC